MLTQLQYTDNLIYSRISMLSSENLKQELMFYLDYLLNKQFTEKEEKRKPKFGCAKGMFIMSPDFDEPLDDFNEYMP